MRDIRDIDEVRHKLDQSDIVKIAASELAVLVLDQLGIMIIVDWTAVDPTRTSTAFLQVVEYAQFDVDQCNIPAINSVSHYGRD